MARQTQSEKSVVKAAVKALNEMPRTQAHKFHGTQFGCGELDVYGCSEGYAFFLEAKAPGKESTLTPRQGSLLRKWEATGAITGVFTSRDEALGIVAAGVAERKRRLP